MSDFLNTVRIRKLQEVELLRKTMDRTIENVYAALRVKEIAVIAEVKRHSPAKGHLSDIPDPIVLAREYAKGGANMISVLTDAAFYASIQDLQQVVAANIDVPLLRKDFIIDPLQILESKLLGASAILLIVALVGEQLHELLDTASRIGLASIVEVHNQSELDIALNSEAKIIGINNRNLHTLKVDPQVSLDLVAQIPAHIIKVAESGIDHPDLAQIYRQAGFDAVLIGEALVKANNRAKFIKSLKEHL